MYGIVVADIYGVSESTLCIGVGVVPQSVDRLASNVVLAEEEAVEGIEPCVALCLAPLMDGLSLVCAVRRTLDIACVARGFLGERQLEDRVTVVEYAVVALVDERVHVVWIERMLALGDYRVCVGTCQFVVLPVVFRALHSAVALRIALVRTERIATCRESDT